MDLSEPISEYQIPLLHQFPASVLDYLPQGSLVLVHDLSILESTVAEIEEQAVKLRAESIAEGTLAEDFPVPYLSWSELADTLGGHTCLELGLSTAEELATFIRSGHEISAWPLNSVNWNALVDV